MKRFVTERDSQIRFLVSKQIRVLVVATNNEEIHSIATDSGDLELFISVMKK